LQNNRKKNVCNDFIKNNPANTAGLFFWGVYDKIPNGKKKLSRPQSSSTFSSRVHGEKSEMRTEKT
jgi:hypothetical protein